VLSDTVPIHLTGYVLDQPPQELCRVGYSSDGRSMSWQGKRISCTSNGNPPPMDRPLTVLRAITNPTKDKEDQPRHLFYHIATVIMDTEEYGHVENSIRAILDGDIVVPYISSKRNILPLEEPTMTKESTQTATIIGFSDPGRFLAESQSFLFLDKGTQAGYQEGSIFSIYRGLNSTANETLGSLEVLSDKNNLQIGVIEVLQASTHGSVAYVHWVNEVIYQDDDIGLPRHTPPNS
ncbi:MAG: hypothetical protein OXT67_07560, partial [Zetaproteobacteria bacterium]|nr:hypothetical protein [Zetaproteobacteria bacterium]